jgi:hypothetical protein
VDGSQETYDYSFKVLHEQIAEKDLFEDQTHESVAGTLFTLIDTADRGITIGLEGSWGSGKSTVIHLLESKLHSATDKKTLFFTFDAWAHDGDPLRKIFLESLIEQIDPNGKDDEFTGLKSQVSARSKKVDVTTKKGVSKLGTIISVSAFLVPLGAAILSALNYEKLLTPWHEQAGPMSWAFFWGLFFVLMPILVMLGWWVASKFLKSLTWDFFESDSVENYTQDITEDGERTSIEFERFFSEIMTKLLAGDSPYERSVIVIDNLDRVDPDYAQNIWSTLQTFFQHRSHSKNKTVGHWRDKLWFIVPFDREGLCKVWATSSASYKLNDSTGTDEFSVASDRKDVARSFFEKCFQVIAEVPPAVMSAWISYFDQAVKNSLTGWPKDAINEFRATYVRCMSKLESSPTPREMHSVINKAGITALEFKDKFSPEAVCIYAILKGAKSESQIRKGLLSSGIPGGLPNARPEYDIRAHLAGLLFKVTPEKGIQLLLAPEIRTALNQGDGEKLKTMESLHGEAFWVVWLASKANWQITESHIDEYKIKFTHALYEAFNTKKYRIQSDIINLVNVWKQTFDSWRFEEFSFAQSMSEILELTERDSDFLLWLSGMMKGKLKTVLSKLASDDFPESQLTFLCELEKFLSENGFPSRQVPNAKLTFEGWTKWLNHLDNYDLTFQSVVPDKGVIQQLTQLTFQTTTADKELLSRLIKTYKIYPKSAEWVSSLDIIINWLNLPNREFDVEQLYHFVLRLLTESGEKAKIKIKTCVDNAAFWARSSQATIAKNPSLPILAALCVSDLHEKNFISESFKNYWHEIKDKIEPNELVGFFENADSIANLWKLAAVPHYAGAKELIKRTGNLAVFDNEYAVVNLDYVFNEDDPDLERITLAICQSGAVKRQEAEILENITDYHKVIYYLSKYGDEDAKQFVDKVLDGFTEEDWLISIRKKSSFLRCLSKKSRTFTKAFSTFIIDCLKLSDFQLGEWIWADFDYYYSKLMDAKRQVFPDITKEYFMLSNDPIDNELFDIFSNYLLEQVANIDSLSIQNRVIFWLENKMLERVQWLLTAEFGFKEEPLEALMSLTIDLAKSDSENLETYKKVAAKFGFENSFGVDFEGNRFTNISETTVD